MPGVSGIYRYYLFSVILFIFLAIMWFVFGNMYSGKTWGTSQSTLTTIPGILGGFYI